MVRKTEFTAFKAQMLFLVLAMGILPVIAAEEIQSVAITITAPVTGEEPVEEAIMVGPSANFTPGNVDWNPKGQHNTLDKFVGGVKYTATVTLTADEGYTFTGANGDVMTINGDVAVVEDNNGSTITLSYEFPVTDETITSVELFVTTPIVGAYPSNPTTVPNAHFDMYSTWKPSMPSLKFEEGTRYTIDVTLAAHEGYTFSGVRSVFVNGKAAIIDEITGTSMKLHYRFEVTRFISTMIDGKDMEINNGIVKFHAACGASEVNIEVTTDPNAEITIGNQIKKQSIKYTMQVRDYGDNRLPVSIKLEDASQNYTIVVNKPIRFDDIVKQKWNNVLVVKNNDAEHGGFFFTEFQWFKDDQAIPGATRQFYSVDPVNGSTLNSTNKYFVQMKTRDGMEVNSCVGQPRPSSNSPAVQKQVLGINGKAVPQDSEIYNTNGERTTGKTPGVYIIRRTSK